MKNMFRNAFAVAAVLSFGLLGLNACFESGNPSGSGCTAHSDCDAKAGLICSAQGQCVAGQLCSDDDDCTDVDKRCNKDRGVCESDFQCGDDNPCPAGQHCTTSGYCEDDSIEQGDVGDDCSAKYPCKEGLVCGSDDKCEEPSEDALPYKFVRVDDLYKKGDTNSKEDYGADIDAIVLDKADGQPSYAKNVVDYKHGGGFYTGSHEAEADVASKKVLGAPDSFYEYPEVTNCHLYINKDPSNAAFVSLGGEGGYIIVEMEKAIEKGDKLDVLEVGDCTYDDDADGKGGKAVKEPVKVQISVAADAIDSQWVVLTEKSDGPKITSVIPDLPAVKNSDVQHKAAE